MYRLILIVPICLMLMLSACATTERVPQRIVTIRNVVFDYIPPAGAEPGAAEMIIILVNPQYAASFEDARSEPFVSFAKSMGNDFEETLTTRGYKVMGPYRSYDELVYSVKEEGDVILDVEIDLTIKLDEVTAERDYSWNAIITGEKRLFLNGAVSIFGKLNMKAIEPLSSEKIWVKSIPINPVSFGIKTTTPLTEVELKRDPFPLSDPGVYNPLSLKLEVIYKEAMSKAYIYLEPKELQQLKPQIQKIKDRVRH